MSSRNHPIYEVLLWCKRNVTDLTSLGPQGFLDLIKSAPRVYFLWWQDLVTSSPQHILIETALIIFIIWLVFIRRTVDPKKAATNKLSEKEINWLVETWEPEPLVPALTPKAEAMTSGMMVIESIDGLYLKIKGISNNVLSLSSFDFLNLSQDASVKEASAEALKVYGCGSCGPRGFYGTIDQHLNFESAMAKFLGTEQAISYSCGASAVTSTIPAFSKKGDLLILDEACSEPILTGCNLSRSTVQFFKHNDMKDLEAVLRKIESDDKRLRRDASKQRRFIVVEGVYRNTGDICPLKEILALKKKYCYRLIMDESLSFGTMGKTGKGLTEHFGIDISEIEIVTVAMDTSLASIGGLCVGSREIVDHQRLSGAGYCFSAAAPPFLSAAACVSLEKMATTPSLLKNLHENAKYLRDGLSKLKHLALYSTDATPIIHLVFKPALKTREDEEIMMMKLARACVEKGVGVVASKFALAHGSDSNLRPSLRICVSSAHTKAQLNSAIEMIESACKSVLK